VIIGIVAAVNPNAFKSGSDSSGVESNGGTKSVESSNDGFHNVRNGGGGSGGDGGGKSRSSSRNRRRRRRRRRRRVC